MRRLFSHLIASVAVMACISGVSQASILYTQNFDTDDTANWKINVPAAIPPAGVVDYIANFYYDYNAIGVPSSTGPGGTTRGIKLTANNTAGVFSGISVSPLGQNFAANTNYRVEFDLWQNYLGGLGAGGSGTTQLSTFGVATSGNVAFHASSAKESVGFAATLDGLGASSFRAYSSAASTSYASGNAVYQAPSGVNNSLNAYYTSAFPAHGAPSAQLTLYPAQTGNTDAGELGFAWRHVVMEVNGGFATWSVDGLAFAKVPMAGLTLGGGNIFFGHADTNAGVSSSGNSSILNVTLIDNVTVTAIPEPSTMLVAVVGLVSLAGWKRWS